MPTTDQLLLYLILYALLPLWGITGFVDWCCHRATGIERTSGLRVLRSATRERARRQRRFSSMYGRTHSTPMNAR